MSRIRLSAIVLAGLACAPATSQQRPNPASPSPAQRPAAGAQTAQAGARPDTARPAAARGGMRPFAEVTAGATKREGFFDTYEKDGALYLAVPRDRLGREFLAVAEIAQGVGSNSLFGGTMLNRAVSVIALEKRGDKLFLVERPTQFTAPAGSAVERAVELTFGSSVLEAAKIETVRPDSAYVINIHDWFVSDISDVGSIVRFAVAPRPGQPGRATLDKNRSYLESVRAFPNNLNIRAKLTFTPGEPVGVAGVPDSRYIPVSIFYTLAALPEQPMTPRQADDRTGYFMTVRKDFSRDERSFFVRYVNRWRLECAQPAAEGQLCEPKKPLIYYLDTNIPEQYRPYIMEGVNRWARAFEQAGFRNAIRAEMLPAGADAEDIRYPTLRWNVSTEPGYGAIGPSITDPRTGEILDADILIEGSMVTGFRNSWRTLVSPAEAIEEMLTASPEELSGLSLGGEAASLAGEISAQGTFLRAMLAAEGRIGPNEPVPMEFVGQALVWVTMHEVGHTLGLRHNFRASVDTPLENLYDSRWTGERGVYSSVMDYPAVNIAPRGKRNDNFYNTGAGTSDIWMIAYGYSPDSARAASLARQAAQPGNAYGTDEDARGAGALDPTVNVYDLGADPLAWGKQQAGLIRSLWPNLPQAALDDNSRYADLTDAFNTLLVQYVRAVATGVKYIGGQYQYRDHVGDPNARAPFVPVTPAKQREALAFLNEYAFSENAFTVPQNVLSRFGANRWSHWGETNTFDGRIDYPLHERVLGAQTMLLAQVLHPFVFARIHDAEVKFGPSAVLSIPELMRELTGSVWSEVYAGASNVPSMRRDLQRSYLDRMEQLVIGAPERLPADARSVGRVQLRDLKRRVDARLAGGQGDAYTRAHLAETSARIEKILEAGLDSR